MELKQLIWDYPHVLKDDEWRARRMAEFFPFVQEALTQEDKELILKHVDKISLPEERKELIRMVCHGEPDTD